MRETFKRIIETVLGQERYQERLKKMDVDLATLKVDLKPTFPSCDTCGRSSYDDQLTINFTSTKPMQNGLVNYYPMGYFTATLAYFPGCCGAKIIHHAGIDYYNFHKGFGRLFMEVLVEAYGRPDNDDRPGMLVGITSSETSEYMYPILKGLGFHRAGHGGIINGNTGHPLALWYKDLEAEWDEPEEDDD